MANKFYDAMMKRIREQAEAAIKDAGRKAKLKYFENDADKAARELFVKVLDEWYRDYTPKYYRRRYSLYDAVESEIDDTGWSLWFDDEKVGEYRRSDGSTYNMTTSGHGGYGVEDRLFIKAFMEGWHGGAKSGRKHPSPGVPYWRMPEPYYSHWGRPAKRTLFAGLTPHEELVRRFRHYESTIGQQRLDEYYQEYLSQLSFHF